MIIMITEKKHVEFREREMQNIYNSVKSGGLKVFIGAGKKCQRIKMHVLGCRILDSSSEGVKIPGPINFWWF